MKTLFFILCLITTQHNDTIDDVAATVYNPVTTQCNGNPLETADGSIINMAKLERGEIKWVAVSRDLLKTFKFGDKVEIISSDKRISGVYIVHDTMAKKWTKKVDILMPSKFSKGKWTVKIRKYEKRN